MKKLLLIACICVHMTAVGQNFLIGSATASLEPGDAAVSSALAGYGIPREGRFSITWEEVNESPPLKSITSYQDGFLAINDEEELLLGRLQKKSIVWKNLGKATDVSVLASSGTKIYAISSKGELLMGKLKSNKISWKKTDHFQRFSALTSLNHHLYATTDSELLEGKIEKSGIQWRKISTAENIISLTNDDRMLYALNQGDTIWSVKPYMDKKAWTIIGRNNGYTFTENLKDIAVFNNVLYAVNNGNQLLKGNHKSNGDLAVNALAIKGENETVVIAGVDVCGFDASFVNSIKSYFHQKHKLPEAAILINASHTHFAPVTQSWATWGEFYHVPDTNYLNNVVSKGIIAAIEEALANMEPADIFFGRGTTAIGVNRRSTKEITRPYDNTLDVIKIQIGNERIKSILFSAGCHPVFQNKGEESYTLGANYPSIARQHICNHMHTDHSLFLQGCGGDINPQEKSYHSTGDTLGSEVIKILESPMQRLGNTISFYLDTIEIPLNVWPIEKIKAFRAENLVKPGDIYAEKNVRWADLMMERYRRNDVQGNMPIYVQTINIGQWKLVGLSREAVTEYGLAIRALWPDRLVTVAGYCNDVSSYLPVNWHIETEVYEGLESFFWYGQNGIPKSNIKDIIIEKIKSRNR